MSARVSVEPVAFRGHEVPAGSNVLYSPWVTHRLLSVWDRLFRSYQAEPRDGHRDMRIGLPAYRLPAHQRVMALLGQPLEP